MAAADCGQLEMARASAEAVAESLWQDEAGATPEYGMTAAWQWCAWQSTSFEPCDVMIENLPVAIANDDDCIEAMLQQAGLTQSLIAFERQGKKSGKVLVSLENRMAAEFCVAHFESCTWIRHKNGGKVQAHILAEAASGDQQEVTAEPKEVVTKYLPIKLHGQRVLHQLAPGTYRVEIPRHFWHLVGIAYRKSMNLDDRDTHGIDHGEIVHGKQMNGWLAVKFESHFEASGAPETVEPNATLKLEESFRSRRAESGKHSNWKPATADHDGRASGTTCQASVLEAEGSESELSSPRKSDSHGAETTCPSNDDSEHSSQVQTGQDSADTENLALTFGKHVVRGIAWADEETDDEEDFGA